jgi:hypothetical protein
LAVLQELAERAPARINRQPVKNVRGNIVCPFAERSSSSLSYDLSSCRVKDETVARASA